MSLVIKDADIDALAHAVAERTGESVADAIRHALKARMALCDVSQAAVPVAAPLRTREEKIAFMEDIGRRFVTHLKKPMSSTDTDDLYDEWGLPK
jgi:hypothetical protein